MADRQRRKKNPSDRPAKPSVSSPPLGSTGSARAGSPAVTPPSRPAKQPTAVPPARASRLGIPAWSIAAIGVLVVAIVIGGYYALHGSVGSSSVPSGPMGYTVKDEGRNHVTEGSFIQYQHSPPSSGSHYPAPKDWGFYDQPVAPGYFVHNLEHGGVVVLYDCPSGCPDLVTQLKQVQQTFPKEKYGEVKMLISPYHPLPDGAQVSVLAWDREFDFTKGFNQNQLLQFYQQYVDHGPEDIP